MKNLITESLESRILKYSIVAGAILAAQSSANASVVVTSSGHGLPATVNSGSPSYSINFDNTSTSEIKIGYRYNIGYTSGDNGPLLNVKRDGATGTVSFIGKTVAGYAYPYALSQNYGVPSAGKWIHASSLNYPNFSGMLAFIPKSFAPHGYWRDQTTAKYLDVKFHLSDGVHYGWVKMTTSGASSAIILAYAYETSVNTPIVSPLPVELTTFTAKNVGNKVELKWNTATEVNNYGFEIQRTIQNSKLKIQKWEKIGFVKGLGNSNSPKSYSFVDASPLGENSIDGIAEYRLKQINNNGQFVYSKTVEVTSLPAQFNLGQNYPNPFNPTTTIQYAVPKAEHVILKVYDEIGKEVATLVNENKEAGRYNVQFNGSGLASGVYYYRINAGSFSKVKKLMLLK